MFWQDMFRLAFNYRKQKRREELFAATKLSHVTVSGGDSDDDSE
jgi:hypothetical protein